MSRLVGDLQTGRAQRLEPPAQPAPAECTPLLVAVLPDKLVREAVDGWRAHPESKAMALGAAFLGLLAGGVADAVELGTGTCAGLLRLARAGLGSRGVSVGDSTAVTQALADALGGSEVPSSARLSRHPDVQGKLRDRDVTLSFPDGGLPWRIQGKRMRVTLAVPGAADARIRRDRANADLIKAGADPIFVKASQFAGVELFDAAGSDLVLAKGRAEIEIVLPKKVDKMSAKEIEKVLHHLAETIDQLT